MFNKISIKVLFFILFFLRIPFLYSQITVGSLGITETKVTVVEKPQGYDSLKNFPYPLNDHGYPQNDSNLYNSYIGLDLYIPPHVPTYGDGYYKITDVYYVFKYLRNTSWAANEDADKLMKDYIKVTKLEPHPVVMAPYDQKYLYNFPDLSNNPYLFLHTFDCLRDSLKYPVDYLFLLKNNKTGDLIYYSPDYGQYGGVHVIMVPYFIKQQKMYDGKNVFYTGADTEMIDTKTGDKISVVKDSKWKCKVSVIRESQATYREDPKHHIMRDYVVPNTYYDQYCLYYTLSNGTNELLIPGENPPVMLLRGAWDEIKRTRVMYKFATEEKYNQTQQELEALAIKEKEVQRQYKEQCIKQWGSKYGGFIAEHKVVRGMTKDMCKAAWGEPYDVFQTISGSGDSQYNSEWLYSWKSFLYFRDDILVNVAN